MRCLIAALMLLGLAACANGVAPDLPINCQTFGRNPISDCNYR